MDIAVHVQLLGKLDFQGISGLSTVDVLLQLNKRYVSTYLYLFFDQDSAYSYARMRVHWAWNG